MMHSMLMIVHMMMRIIIPHMPIMHMMLLFCITRISMPIMLLMMLILIGIIIKNMHHMILQNTENMPKTIHNPTHYDRRI